MKSEFKENYEKFFDDSLHRLRRALKLRLKAQEICAEREETLSIGGASCFSDNVNHYAIDNGQDIVKDLKADDKGDNVEEKKNQIDYGLAAINLNKIDEESVED